MKANNDKKNNVYMLKYTQMTNSQLEHWRDLLYRDQVTISKAAMCSTIMTMAAAAIAGDATPLAN